MNKVEYEEQLNKAIGDIQALMQKEWGYAPLLDVEVEEALVVRVGFNMKGFAHDKTKIHVTPQNEKNTTPQKVAKKIGKEILFHRNSCKECGEPTTDLNSIAYSLSEETLAWRVKKEDLMREIDNVERELMPTTVKRVEKLRQDPDLIARIEQKKEKPHLLRDKVTGKEEWYYTLLPHLWLSEHVELWEHAARVLGEDKHRTYDSIFAFLLGDRRIHSTMRDLCLEMVDTGRFVSNTGEPVTREDIEDLWWIG